LDFEIGPLLPASVSLTSVGFLMLILAGMEQTKSSKLEAHQSQMKNFC